MNRRGCYLIIDYILFATTVIDNIHTCIMEEYYEVNDYVANYLLHNKNIRESNWEFNWVFVLEF